MKKRTQGISFPDEAEFGLIVAAAELSGGNISKFIRESAVIMAKLALGRQRVPLKEALKK